MSLLCWTRMLVMPRRLSAVLDVDGVTQGPYPTQYAGYGSRCMPHIHNVMPCLCPFAVREVERIMHGAGRLPHAPMAAHAPDLLEHKGVLKQRCVCPAKMRSMPSRAGKPYSEPAPIHVGRSLASTSILDTRRIHDRRFSMNICTSLTSVHSQYLTRLSACK